MTAKNLIEFIGLESTNPKIVDWLNQNEIGKPPKTVNANQGEKYIKDKINNLG